MRSSLGVVLLFAVACSTSAPPAPAPAPLPRRTDVINRAGAPLTLVGKTLEVGDRMPDVTLADAKLQPIALSSFAGKLVVLSVVPSIDTRVCESQTHHVSDAIARLPADAVVMTVSRDLPFAQERFAEEAKTQTRFGSDYKGGGFGRAFGLEVEETGLLARSVWVIDRTGTIVYRELVADQATEPDLEPMIAAATKAGS